MIIKKVHKVWLVTFSTLEWLHNNLDNLLFQADIINVHEYKNWRNTGVAFEVREADYDIPNKTVASGLILTQVSTLGYFKSFAL